MSSVRGSSAQFRSTFHADGSPHRSRTSASVFAFALGGNGIRTDLALTAEAAFRLGRILLPLRLPDLAITSFLTFSHVRMFFP